MTIVASLAVRLLFPSVLLLSVDVSQAQVRHPLATPGERPWVSSDGTVEWRGRHFDSLEAYFAARDPAEYRCGAGMGSIVEPPPGGVAGAGAASDCSGGQTNPDGIYDPDAGIDYCIPVVFHVLRDDTGTVGDVTDENLFRQINILNEDFNASPWSNGADGENTRIRFRLYNIFRYDDSNALNDEGDYWSSRAVDPHRFLNIYTNTAGGRLGYANIPQAPEHGSVGSASDRVVLAYPYVGSGAAPYDLGRTGTHEVGHYLGLYHTFHDGCDSGSCHNSGDLICDTNSEAFPHYGCAPRTSCGSVDPIENYMDYSDDACMREFTNDQARRMRCTLQHWRPLLASVDECRFVCGEDGAGSPYQSRTTPGCNQPFCCASVCDADPYCCAIAWDVQCVDRALTDCGDCGDSNAGSPWEANGSPGCDDLACCAAVCAVDAFCCNAAWDGACLEQAFINCGGCGDPTSGSPWTANGSPGSSDEACCVSVCNADEYCCDVEWDTICVETATIECAGCGVPEAGSCFVTHPVDAVGCDDSLCCTDICSLDPFCCEERWDQICASGAAQLCIGWCRGDLDFDGDVDGSDLGVFLASWGDTGVIADLDGDGVVNGADMGLLLSGWGACDY